MSQSTRGLSPRARGNPRVRDERRAEARSIPACAGEPNSANALSASVRVYPRVRGGTAPGHSLSCGTKGLSPRARGNLASGHGGDAGGGSIPACAGEPSRVASRGCRGTVYPRVRGGTGYLPQSVAPSWGLSPRARGNPAIIESRRCWSGSIPACAGEPPTCSATRAGTTVYPRVRGGTSKPVRRNSIPKGLSPRARGNLDGLSGLRGIAGSIPACAGEPAATVAILWLTAVYPRVRGGTKAIPWDTSVFTGLSPRARGNPFRPQLLGKG